MSENFLKPDDVTMELATVLDEFSAVDCYRLKKDAPLGLRKKKTLSYKAVLAAKYPRTPSTSEEKYRLPDSIDMDYIDMLSGKNSFMRKDEEKKVPIRMESFEKLCYYPDLTETQKQSISEARRKLELAQQEDDLSETASSEPEEKIRTKGTISTFSPCCYELKASSSSSLSGEDYTPSQKESPIPDEKIADGTITDDAIGITEARGSIEQVPASYEPFVTGELSAIPEESNGNHDGAPVLAAADTEGNNAEINTEESNVNHDGTPVLIAADAEGNNTEINTEVSNNVAPVTTTTNEEEMKINPLSEETLNADIPLKKKKVSIFRRLFSRRPKKKKV